MLEQPIVFHRKDVPDLLVPKDLVVYLKTTETCQLNCKHCFTNGINGRKIYFNPDATINWFQNLHQEISTFNTGSIIFHGGEPFLVDTCEMRDVWFFTKNKLPNVTYGATTNLVFKLYEKHIGLIEDAFNRRIATSWDPKIRFENNKQYALWHKNVKTLLSRNITVKLNISVTQDTINML